jgi:hypothetical protein
MGPWDSPLQEKDYCIVKFEITSSLPTTYLCLVIYVIVAVGNESAMNLGNQDEGLTENSLGQAELLAEKLPHG